MSADEKLLEVDHVTVSFHIGGLLAGGQLVAVNDVSFALYADKPQIYSIAGESGSGKSHAFFDSLEAWAAGKSVSAEFARVVQSDTAFAAALKAAGWTEAANVFTLDRNAQRGETQ